MIGVQDRQCGDRGVEAPVDLEQPYGIPATGTPDSRRWAGRSAEEPRMEFSAVASLPTSHGLFQVQAVRVPEGTETNSEHLIVFKGDIAGHESVPVRIHSSCVTGETLSSLRCDCDQQLSAALQLLEVEGRGVVIYLRQEGRGIGLFNKINAYALQDEGLDTVEANLELGLPSDSRTYEIAVGIMKELNILSVRLLTNNPRKITALEQHGITVTERVPLRIPATAHSDRYLEAKRRKLSHLL
jgi:GTP cyclohydrolase II